MDENEDKVLDIALDDLFKDPEEAATTQDSEKSSQEPSEMTKEMSKRINEVRAKTERETRDSMAKELGYESYDAMKRASEKQVLKDAGLDDSEIEPIVQKLLDKRFAEDPRMKRLEAFEAKQKESFVTEQLKEISKLTGNNYKAVNELPKEVLTLWEKTGNLKQAFLAIQGEAIIQKSLAGKQNGSLAHLANPGSTGVGTKERPLTDEEKAIWRMVNPDITDEELAKKTTSIN